MACLFTTTELYRNSHYNRQGLFRSTAADSKRAAFIDAGRLADTDPVTGHYEARLLLFGVDWCVWIADTTATVCAERSRSTSVLGEEIRTHNSISPRTSLVESPGEDPIQYRLCVLTHRCLHGTAPPYIAETLQLTTEVDARCRLRSANTSTLIVPSTRRSTLGDRAFPVAAARARNTLPASVRSTPSLAGFRQQLKPTRFRASHP